jgi:predicted permease
MEIEMITLILFLVILGVGLYLIETYVPMAAPIKLIIRIVVVIFVVLLLLKAFGISDIPIPIR